MSLLTPKKILAIDLYGTLLSTSSIAPKLASHLPDTPHRSTLADTITTDWRKLQLEYTWRLNSMEKYIPFSTVTRLSLLDALHSANVTLSPAAVEDVLAAYDQLAPFDDVAALLDALATLAAVRKSGGGEEAVVDAVVFTNGTEAQFRAATAAATAAASKNGEGLGGLGELWELRCISVDSAGDGVGGGTGKCFKPHPAAYTHLLRELGVPAGTGAGGASSAVLVSANPFDIVGARSVGMLAVWVDREGSGWSDGLGTPSVSVRGLGEVVAWVVEQMKTQTQT